MFGPIVADSFGMTCKEEKHRALLKGTLSRQRSIPGQDHEGECFALVEFKERGEGRRRPEKRWEVSLLTWLGGT